MGTGIFTTDLAAERLGISAAMVRRYCQQGRIGFKLGGRWLIAEDQLAEFCAQPRPTGYPKGRPRKGPGAFDVEQVAWIVALATGIADSLTGGTAAELVEYVMSDYGREWSRIKIPDWFDDRARALLVRNVEIRIGQIPQSEC